MNQKNRILQGIPASPGIVLGRAQVLSERSGALAPLRLLYTEKEVSEEMDRFRLAVDRTEEEIIRLK